MSLVLTDECVVFNKWNLPPFSSTVQNVSCLQRVFSAGSICFTCLLSQLGARKWSQKNAVLELKQYVLLAASEVVGVPTAWGIEWASSGLSCSHTGFPVLHCEFSVDFKNLQVCTVAYKFGLPLLFLGDMNKFLSKGNVLSGELFLYYVFRFEFVSTQLAQSTGRMSSILYVTVHFYVRQNLV